jgi:hypothetical protein
LDELLSDIKNLFEQDCAGPFPYAGCRNVLRAAGPGYEDLIPDLDMYFYTIASHAGGAAKILQWPPEKILKAEAALKHSFFERHQRYQPLQQQITTENAPDLYADLELHEKMRATLLHLLSLLLRRK